MSEVDENFFDTASAEKLTTAERLKLAKKKRAQQLKKYVQHEKQLEKEFGKKARKSAPAPRAVGRGVRFGENIVLLEAASRNDIEEVRSLLLSGVDPNVGNEDGLTALHQCCIDNLEEMLRLLVEFGASVNSCDSELWTPLHAAATCGHSQLCRYLVEQGADLLSVNGDGNLPYDICEHDATLDFIESEMAKRGVTQDLINEMRLIPEKKMLDDLKERLENETSLEFRGRNGETPLHIASTNGYVEVTQFLLDHKVSINVTDSDLWQPIHCAAFWCQVPVVELLLQHGASLDVRTRNGESPIDICDDAETKKRILELKKLFHTGCRGFRSRGVLSRQRSSSIRRGSVRRSSMKEKKALSQKASREEGRWLQDAVMLNNDDEDEEANSSNNRVPENHLPNSSTPASDVNDVTENSTNAPRPVVPTTATPPLQDDLTSPSRKPRLSGTPSALRKGTRLLAKEDATELDQRYVEPLDDLERRWDITTLLIEDANRSEKSNGSRNHSLSKDSESGAHFNPGVNRGRRARCGGECCVLQ